MAIFWLGTSWKMNKTLEEARGYARVLASRADLAATGVDTETAEVDTEVRRLGAEAAGVEVFVVPPFTALALVARELAGCRVRVGAQNMHWADEGAGTGEISARMVRDCGATLVELGHSERRVAFGETDCTVNLKVHAALRVGLRPLICVGDTAQERTFGVSAESVVRQVKMALHEVAAADMPRALIAYEPVWAIGDAGTPAEPDYAAKIHAAIRAALADLAPESGRRVPILYGGSVNLSNAASFCGIANVDGLFVGRAAWRAQGLLDLKCVVERAIGCPRGGAASVAP